MAARMSESVLTETTARSKSWTAAPTSVPDFARRRTWDEKRGSAGLGMRNEGSERDRHVVWYERGRSRV
eukprot:3366744-Rhodomonas_salina.1